MIVDLHIHTNYSDGTYTPLQVYTNNQLNKILAYLVDNGIDGVESEYLAFNSYQRESLRKLAKRYSLYMSTGSDFHGYPNRDLFVTEESCQTKDLLCRLGV